MYLSEWAGEKCKEKGKVQNEMTEMRLSIYWLSLCLRWIYNIRMNKKHFCRIPLHIQQKPCAEEKRKNITREEGKNQQKIKQNINTKIQSYCMKYARYVDRNTSLSVLLRAFNSSDSSTLLLHFFRRCFFFFFIFFSFFSFSFSHLLSHRTYKYSIGF